MATVYRRRGRGCKVLTLFGIGTGSGGLAAFPSGCGCSSGVEHDLAKVGVEGSNPFARSNFSSGINSIADARKTHSVMIGRIQHDRATRRNAGDLLLSRLALHAGGRWLI